MLINTPTSKKINIDGIPAEILLIIPFSIVDQSIFFINPNANKRTMPNKIGMCGETSNLITLKPMQKKIKLLKEQTQFLKPLFSLLSNVK